MDNQELKKMVAGISIVSLLAAVLVAGCATPARSSCAGEKDEKSTKGQGS